MLGLDLPGAAAGFALVKRTWPVRSRPACDSNDNDSFKNQQELLGESPVNFVRRGPGVEAALAGPLRRTMAARVGILLR